MAKKAIKKMDFSEIKKNFSQSTKYKEQKYFLCGEDFLEISGLPGPAQGHINMFIGHTDSGKAQPLSSKVLTPNGWKLMGDIKVGDEVIGSDGKTQNVLGVFPQGERPVYKVEFDDNTFVYCDEEHLWSVKTHRDRVNKKGFRTFPTIDMVGNVFTTSETRRNYQLPTIKPVEFNSETLEIDSYVLGTFLGKGEKELNNIYLDEETKEKIGLLNLTSCEPNNKFIPKKYIFNNTIEGRINLLNGLLDTNGYITKQGTLEYTTISEQLANDVKDLVNSLGGVVRIRNKYQEYNYLNEEKIGKNIFTLSIRLPKDIKAFKLEQKNEKLNPNRKHPVRHINNILFSHNEECQCILVSNDDHLYITDNFILTHNTTALVKAMVDAQKQGVLPVIIITEKKWDFPHAALMGMDATLNDETGEWEGFFIFNDSFCYVEQITDYINLLLDAQEKGELPYDLAFFWDSVGSVPCKLTYEGKGGKQHTAGVLSEKIGMGLNNRIASSRKEESKYTNTLTIINQPWVWIDQKNPNSAPQIKGKGGESIWLNATLVFRFGNIQNAGTSKLNAQNKNRKVTYATRTKVTVVKNHINGLGYADGKILITPHGFMKETDSKIKKYKEEYLGYWRDLLGGEDFEIVDEEIDLKKFKVNDEEVEEIIEDDGE